jgi:hypothetical protein
MTGSMDVSSPVIHLQGSRLWVSGQDGIRQVDARKGLPGSSLTIKRTARDIAQSSAIRVPSSSRSIWSSDREFTI